MEYVVIIILLILFSLIRGLLRGGEGGRPEQQPEDSRQQRIPRQRLPDRFWIEEKLEGEKGEPLISSPAEAKESEEKIAGEGEEDYSREEGGGRPPGMRIFIDREWSLAEGIVMAEILGPPRGRKPHSTTSWTER